VLGGDEGGFFEAFAYDDRDYPNSPPTFYVTDDQVNGTVRRYTPQDGADLEWDALHGPGKLEFLVLLPNSHFFWSSSIEEGMESAFESFQNVEGIVHRNGILSFVAKRHKQLFHLNLDEFTYEVESTEVGALPGGRKIQQRTRPAADEPR